MVKFTQTFLYRIGADWTAQDIETSKKYDLIAVQGFRWNTVEDDTWSEMKKANPNVLIFPYYQSRILDSEDHKRNPYKGSLARWDISRGHSMGNCNINNTDFFLLNAREERVNGAQPQNFVPDYGNERYMRYWVEGWRTDNLNQPWQADGVMIDEVQLLVEKSGATSSPVGIDWTPEIINWIVNVSTEMSSHNTKVWLNSGTVQKQSMIDAYVELDMDPDNKVYMASSEGAFVVCWGAGDCQFYAEHIWLLQVQAAENIHNMRYGIQSTVGGSFRTTDTGLDQYNRPVNLYDAVWYGLCSYHLSKNTIDNNTYFSFTRATYSSGQYYDEMDIDLGNAIGQFKVTNISGNNIYFRKFELGYVYVNPTRNDVSNIPLPETCKKLTHDNFKDDISTIPDVDTFSLASNRGTILIKSEYEDPCEGIVCNNYCDDINHIKYYNGKCVDGECVYDIIENSEECGFVNPCEGVTCPDVCIGKDLYSQRCNPNTGECEPDTLIEEDSILCKIPTDESTIQKYLILGGLGALALIKLLANKE